MEPILIKYKSILQTLQLKDLFLKFKIQLRNTKIYYSLALDNDEIFLFYNV